MKSIQTILPVVAIGMIFYGLYLMSPGAAFAVVGGLLWLDLWFDDWRTKS